jgi:hypothetical protein
MLRRETGEVSRNSLRDLPMVISPHHVAKWQSFPRLPRLRATECIVRHGRAGESLRRASADLQRSEKTASGNPARSILHIYSV